MSYHSSNSLDYGDLKFPISKKDFDRIEKKNSIYINVFGYENGLVYPVHLSDRKFRNFMDLFFIKDENRSHYIYINDFNRFVYNKE